LNLSGSFKERAVSALAFISHEYSINSGGVEVNLSQIDIIVSEILHSSKDNYLRKLLISLSEISPKFVLTYLENRVADENSAKDFIININGNDYIMFLALEMIAQQSFYMPRVCRLFWKITIENKDENIISRGIKCLSEILSLWNPHTAASLSDRMYILLEFLKSDSEQAWRLLMEILPSNRPSHRLNRITPKWRTWLRKYRTNQPEVIEALEILSGCAIDNGNSDPLKYWPDIISILFLLPERSFGDALVSLDSILNNGKYDDELLAVLRSELLSLVYLEKLYWEKEPGRNLDRIEAIEKLLQIRQSNPLFAHCFHIFSEWRPNLNQIDETNDPKTRKEILENERAKSLKELFLSQGLTIVEKLVKVVKNPSMLYSSLNKLDEFKTMENLVKWLHYSNNDLNNIAEQLIIWESKNKENWLSNQIKFLETVEEAKLLQILLCCTLSKDLIQYVSQKPLIENEFWIQRRNFYLPEGGYSIINDLIQKLLIHQRYFDAIDCLNTVISHGFNEVSSKVVIEVLFQNVNPTAYNYSLVTSYAHSLINWLREQIIEEHYLLELEWQYFEVIESYHDLPILTLQKLVSQPVFFVEYYVRRRAEIGNFDNTWERLKCDSRLNNLYSMFHQFSGREQIFENTESVRVFVLTAQKRAGELDISVEIERKLGKLLATCPVDEEDNVWPCIPVRLLLEQRQSNDLMDGFFDGTISPDYITVRSFNNEGHAYGKEIIKYRTASTQLNLRFPRTSKLLHDIADYFEQRNEDHK
jgi:hypothetical protein